MESMLTLSDAKARFSEIVEKTIKGEEFIITRMGSPVVRISRFRKRGQPPKLGDLAGQIRISDDFDEWPTNLQAVLGMVNPNEKKAR